jgi:hypothetical protein
VKRSGREEGRSLDHGANGMAHPLTAVITRVRMMRGTYLSQPLIIPLNRRDNRKRVCLLWTGRTSETTVDGGVASVAKGLLRVFRIYDASHPPFPTI